MIIDTHCHAGRNWFLPIESLEFEMNQAGVDAAVLIPRMVEPFETITCLEKQPNATGDSKWSL
ncbi:MAG: hypothetical protein Ct9H300mP19_14980 [Dehalococcoidia bacterium]|nr:MAG: hypothetical protein Ct9H300mP19_14980 [Dehalococcoidia bacterium]